MKIGLYIHIPFCTAKCSYCDFASFSAGENTQRQYVTALKKEIAERCNGINAQREFTEGRGSNLEIDTVYIGGGTPSVLYRGGLFEIIEEIKKHFYFNPIEFTVEANPESVSLEFVRECKSLGVNRISLGLQTASDKLLKNLRHHTFGDFLRAVEILKGEGIKNISADIMLALPDQKDDDVKDTLTRLIDLGLQHISVYALKVEEGTPLFKRGYLPDDDISAEHYRIACEMLEEKYNRYEISNFCKNGFECKHNQKYWKMQPYLGFGLNASSYSIEKRRTNTRDPSKYLCGMYDDFCEDARPNFLTEYIMLGLRTCDGIDINILEDHGLFIQTNAAFKKHLNSGALIKSGGNLRLNKDYYYIMNSIISDLI